MRTFFFCDFLARAFQCSVHIFLLDQQHKCMCWLLNVLVSCRTPFFAATSGNHGCRPDQRGASQGVFVWYQAVLWRSTTYCDSSWHATGYTPFFLNNGRHPRMPVNLACGEIPSAPSVQVYTETIAEALKRATENLQVAQQRQKTYADEHRRAVSFSPGQKVFWAQKISGTDFLVLPSFCLAS